MAGREERVKGGKKEGRGVKEERVKEVRKQEEKGKEERRRGERREIGRASCRERV